MTFFKKFICPAVAAPSSAFGSLPITLPKTTLLYQRPRQPLLVVPLPHAFDFIGLASLFVKPVEREVIFLLRYPRVALELISRGD